MKARILGAPLFELELDLETVEVLRRIGSCHYDRTCQRAVEHGGFVYGWWNRCQPLPEPFVNEPLVPCTGTFSQLDLVTKILEATNQCGFHPNSDYIKRANKLRDTVHFALLYWNEFNSGGQKWVLEVPERD